MDSSMAKVVEKQMRNWELSRAQRTAAVPQSGAEVEDFIAVSQMVGSGGKEVARLLASRLNWPVFDREILQAMAGDDTLRRSLYESMDERDLGWFENAVRSFAGEQHPRNDYFHKLTETILSLARQGSAVFVGRGADLILPKSIGLRLRLVAPRQQCIAQLARERDLDHSAAEILMREVETERAQFVSNHFRGSAEEQARHDLVINLGHWTPEQAVEIALAARALGDKAQQTSAS